MSRIGKMPVPIPAGVKVDVKHNVVSISGPKGKLSQTFHEDMQIELKDGELRVTRSDDSRQQRSLHGLTRALLSNMVVGVSNGFSKTLLIEGVGYRANMDGKTLVLNVGYSHPIYFEPENDMQFVVEDRGKKIIISGIDKEWVGEIAARIRKTRPPEPYKGKGIRYQNEFVRRKAGKAGKV